MVGADAGVRPDRGSAGMGTSTWQRWKKMTTQKTVLHLKEAVAYARYSNKMSSDRSIEDQFQLCEKIANQYGYKIVQFFEDRAIHGAGTLGRAGWLALMRAATAKDRTFEAVIIESMSRMGWSRQTRVDARQTGLRSSEGAGHVIRARDRSRRREDHQADFHRVRQPRARARDRRPAQS